jgi:hypothetical protein
MCVAAALERAIGLARLGTDEVCEVACGLAGVIRRVRGAGADNQCLDGGGQHRRRLHQISFAVSASE